MWYNLDIDYYFASQKKDKIARFWIYIITVSLIIFIIYFCYKFINCFNNINHDSYRVGNYYSSERKKINNKDDDENVILNFAQ